MTRLASQNASTKQAKQLRRRKKGKLNDLWLIFLRVWILLLWSSNLCGEGGSWRRGCALCHWNCGQHIVLGTLRPCCRVLVHAQGLRKNAWNCVEMLFIFAKAANRNGSVCAATVLVRRAGWGGCLHVRHADCIQAEAKNAKALREPIAGKRRCFACSHPFICLRQRIREKKRRLRMCCAVVAAELMPVNLLTIAPRRTKRFIECICVTMKGILMKAIQQLAPSARVVRQKSLDSFLSHL